MGGWVCGFSMIFQILHKTCFVRFSALFSAPGGGGADGEGGGCVAAHRKANSCVCRLGAGATSPPHAVAYTQEFGPGWGMGGWAAAPLQPLVPVAFCALGHPSNLPKTSHGHGRDSQVSTEVHAVQGLETALPFRRAVTASA